MKEILNLPFRLLECLNEYGKPSSKSGPRLLVKKWEGGRGDICGNIARFTILSCNACETAYVHVYVPVQYEG